MRNCIAYTNRANIIVNKDSPFGSGAEVSRICYTCLEFLTFGFVRITWGRHYTTVCYLNMNTSTKTIIPKKRKGKQITWKVCPNSIAIDVCHFVAGASINLLPVYEWIPDLHVKELVEGPGRMLIVIEWFCAKTGFDTEAKATRR